MTNTEYKLTVDDLIIEYLVHKVKSGYDPSFTQGEFISFLFYFESQMAVYDCLYDGRKLFSRFFNRKHKQGWSTVVDGLTLDAGEKTPMERLYSEKNQDYLIKATYELNESERNLLKSLQYSKVQDIKSVISKWLSNYSKRKIDESIEVDNDDLMIGKYTAAEIVRFVWENYIKGQMEEHMWPKQCTDINKYLFGVDLSEIIGLKPLKQELIELYNVLSKRIAILYHQDKNLCISTDENKCLANANYKLIVEGYEETMEMASLQNKGDYQKKLDIVIPSLTFTEIYEEPFFYWCDGVRCRDTLPDIETINTDITGENVKRLVRTLDETTNLKR